MAAKEKEWNRFTVWALAFMVWAVPIAFIVGFYITTRPQ
ncbi:hypothetical protein QO000_003161 [Alkalihalobacillus hemicentroti]|uniref:YmiA family membrane protein n=1 Tax=Guptibacillus hwajinpoensis TaxID=208199 RepID=A0ABU0K474_9BACL|nr:hypothetical protein [Alkalihalobacillus hemicentroti]